jgi:hypothetical protein
MFHYLTIGLFFYIVTMVNWLNSNQDIIKQVPLKGYLIGFLLMTFAWPIAFPFYILVIVLNSRSK